MSYENVVKSNKARATHGMYLSKTYNVWKSMKQRCHNPNDAAYERYGARGIMVCTRWRKSFEAFLADMGEAPEGKSLDRKKNAKGYSKSNCRWATSVQQQNNMRTNHMVTHNGVTQPLAAWAHETGIAYHVLRHRVKAGWGADKLFSTEDFRGTGSKYTVEYQGKQMHLKELSKLTGVPLQTLYWRFNRGVPLT